MDEGFLNKKWASREDLDRLDYRGNTWGDKRGLLKQALESSSPPPSLESEPAWPDVCGCKMCRGEGFSSTTQQCSTGSDSDPNEACECLRRGAAEGQPLVDACGCKAHSARKHGHIRVARFPEMLSGMMCRDLMPTVFCPQSRRHRR